MSVNRAGCRVVGTVIDGPSLVESFYFFVNNIEKAVLCGAVWCGAVRCYAVLCCVVRCGAVQCGAMQDFWWTV